MPWPLSKWSPPEQIRDMYGRLGSMERQITMPLVIGKRRNWRQPSKKCVTNLERSWPHCVGRKPSRHEVFRNLMVKMYVRDTQSAWGWVLDLFCHEGTSPLWIQIFRNSFSNYFRSKFFFYSGLGLRALTRHRRDPRKHCAGLPKGWTFVMPVFFGAKTWDLFWSTLLERGQRNKPFAWVSNSPDISR